MIHFGLQHVPPTGSKRFGLGQVCDRIFRLLLALLLFLLSLYVLRVLFDFFKQLEIICCDYTVSEKAVRQDELVLRY